MYLNISAYLPVTFVRRMDGSVDFDRKWADYKAGFGDSDGEFWLGLDKLHTLTSTGTYGLWVGMRAWTMETFWAEYSSFSVGPETDKYRLSVSGYNVESTAGDSLTNVSFNLGEMVRVIDYMKFSTRDSDNDINSGSCAKMCKGGWWFAKCQAAKATGLYLLETDTHDATGITWYSVYPDAQQYSFQYMEMQIIPNN